MVRLQSPLMSMTAQKQLGKTLIYKMKGNKAFCTGYSRPGRKNPFSPSADQTKKRNFCAVTTLIWQEKNDAQKAYWNDLAKAQKLNMSGWNLFYKTEFNNQEDILGFSYYGTREYGYFNYGYNN